MDNIKGEKQVLASDCLNNQFFQFAFSTIYATLNENIDNLTPYDKEQFMVFQSQKQILKDLYNVFKVNAEEETEVTEDTKINGAVL